jgi:hypothetical protein
MEELNVFKDGRNVAFYHGGIHRSITICLELLISHPDEPERRSTNYIILGCSRYTARWRVEIDVAEVASNVHLCKNCFQHLLIGEKGKKM